MDFENICNVQAPRNQVQHPHVADFFRSPLSGYQPVDHFSFSRLG